MHHRFQFHGKFVLDMRMYLLLQSVLLGDDRVHGRVPHRQVEVVVQEVVRGLVREDDVGLVHHLGGHHHVRLQQQAGLSLVER